ncbi:MAG: hypothetical protein QXG71_00290 [Nanopusillaceae archaeon]
MNNRIFKNKRGYISFYLVLTFLLAISILIFVIMINVNSTIPSNLNQQISMAVASMVIRNINSLLSSRADNSYNFTVPIIDLIISATFFDNNEFSEIDNILYSTKLYYGNNSINFEYCTDVFCSGNCESEYILPSAYGYIRICGINFESTFGYGKECGQ